MPDSAAATAAPQTNLPELSVSELANAVKRTVERDFDRVRVRGELGRVLIAKSGHLYVDLKDENATHLHGHVEDQRRRADLPARGGPGSGLPRASSRRSPAVRNTS